MEKYNFSHQYFENSSKKLFFKIFYQTFHNTIEILLGIRIITLYSIVHGQFSTYVLNRDMTTGCNYMPTLHRLNFSREKNCRTITGSDNAGAGGENLAGISEPQVILI